MARMVVRVPARIRGPSGASADVRLLVDESILYVELPPELCRKCGIDTSIAGRIVNNAGEEIDCEIGMASISIGGRQAGTIVEKVVGGEPTIGFISLGALAIKVNTITGGLIFNEPFPHLCRTRPT